MKVVVARTLDEALAALDGAGPGARLLAGGTDLLVEMESGRTHPDLVVDVWRVAGLRGIEATDAGLAIGALATCSDLVRSPAVAAHADILAQAAREVGAVQIQNRATLGGNLGTASPAADLNPVLFVLGARVRLCSRRGARELPVEEFVTGYRATARRPDELIESVFVPRRPAGERRGFRKVGTRRAQSISKLVAAVAFDLDDGRVRSLRAAAGSVAERTVLLPTLQQELSGRTLAADDPGRQRIAVACTRAVERDARPRDDVRSTARYRSATLARILARMLQDLSAP